MNALKQNTVCDIYTDDFASFPPDEIGIGSRGDKSLKVFFS
jgi:hypothetical protein